jgi:hypothetical protein
VASARLGRWKHPFDGVTKDNVWRRPVHPAAVVYLSAVL